MPHLLLLAALLPAAPAREDVPSYQRHVSALLSKLGCNGGTCHGAVKGQNGFELSLFAADPDRDHHRLFREANGRRVCVNDPDASPLLRKAAGLAPHQGGKRLAAGGPEYEILRRWIAAGAPLDDEAASRLRGLSVGPAEKSARPGESYALRVTARFADGGSEDVTAYCSFSSLDAAVASVDASGKVTAHKPGEAALIVRYRAAPALAQVVVPRPGAGVATDARPANFIDAHVLAKLARLNYAPADVCDDATFLRRARLDATGELPTPDEVRAFLADDDPHKRDRKIDELLASPAHADLWTLRFCDLLKAADFGVYADALSVEADAPRFQAWVRARLRDNLPYDRFVERILSATGREGRDMAAYADEVREMMAGNAPGRPDLELYARRETLDLYWQRRGSDGVGGAMQVAHAFLGLRLECAQCHRHPHDVWRQEDLLDFANFFMRVRKVGFQDQNEKRFADAAAAYKRLNEEGKKLEAEAKKLKAEEGKRLDEEVKKAQALVAKLTQEADRLEQAKKASESAAKRKESDAAKAAFARAEARRQEIAAIERRAKALPEAARRLMQAEVRLLPTSPPAKVSSPLGTKESARFRLLGEADDATPDRDDPRATVIAWMRRPDNPFFARALVNRVWAHYFGRGIVDPPDHLSPFNPATHPALLRELSEGFVRSGYDLRWLHRALMRSRTYQQKSAAGATPTQRANYASFPIRRLPAEVLLDALSTATGVPERFDLGFNNGEGTRAVEVPYAPRNPFAAMVLEQFGRPGRNAAVQCDCERESGVSVLQVLTLANHPRVWEKIRWPTGRVALLAKEKRGHADRVEELYLAALGRSPSEEERTACVAFVEGAKTAEEGLQGVLWGLMNTREFVLQH